MAKTDLGLVLRSLASEDRVAILDAFVEGVQSPVQASNKLDMPLGNVAYHVRVLRDAGLLKAVAQRPVRGAIENLYEVTPLGRAGRVAARTVARAVDEERGKKR